MKQSLKHRTRSQLVDTLFVLCMFVTCDLKRKFQFALHKSHAGFAINMEPNIIGFAIRGLQTEPEVIAKT